MNQRFIFCLSRFYKKHHRLPTYSEMMEIFNFKSKNSVFKLVQKFIKHGVLSKDSRGKLIPHGILSGVKIVGTVEAGFPTAAEEELADTMSLDEYLIENREATYILKVSGDSMRDAGIVKGDMVLVDRSATPLDGDIVIAEIDGGWTMKYLRKSGKRIFLEPANMKYKNIYPKDELKIAAVVKAVVRKY